MVSALGSLRPSHFFQNGAPSSVSKAFRLPSRAQNSASVDSTTARVGMRGLGRESETPARRRLRRP